MLLAAMVVAAVMLCITPHYSLHHRPSASTCSFHLCFVTFHFNHPLDSPLLDKIPCWASPNMLASSPAEAAMSNPSNTLMWFPTTRVTCNFEPFGAMTWNIISHDTMSTSQLGQAERNAESSERRRSMWDPAVAPCPEDLIQAQLRDRVSRVSKTLPLQAKKGAYSFAPNPRRKYPNTFSYTCGLKPIGSLRRVSRLEWNPKP